MLTPDEVADRTFGAETRDVPPADWLPMSNVPHPWRNMFRSAPKPEWYTDPVNPPSYSAPGGSRP